MRSAWILACTLGEALGIAVVAATYAAIDRGVLPGGGSWILAAGAWEGLSLGAAQAVVLRRTGVRPFAWLSFTMLAAVLGYGLSLVSGAGQAAEGGVNTEPPLGLMIGLAAAMGLVMGSLMGLSQWISARHRIAPLRWIVANAAGWTPAMMAIMLAATLAQRGWSLAGVALLGAGAGAVAGLLVGAVTSLALPAGRNDQ